LLLKRILHDGGLFGLKRAVHGFRLKPDSREAERARVADLRRQVDMTTGKPVSEDPRRR